jgi:hypothetical protein
MHVEEDGRQMSEVSALLADLVRWTVFLIGLWATVSFVFALVVGVHYLGHGAARAWNTIQAGLAFYMALGALLAHPAGWYAAVAVTIINPIEAVVRYRWITTGFRSAARGAVLFQLCLILLLALLLTPSGRAAFNIAAG